MKELIEKFQKMPSAQLVSKMEKGVENEKEREIIINILQKRGRDVTPYVGKSAEEIAEEAKLDQVQKKESASATKEAKSGKVKLPKVEKTKKEKVEKPKKEKSESASKRVRYEDEVFKAEVVVVSDVHSSRMAVGEKAIVKSTFYMEGAEDKKFATLKNEKGEFLARKIEQLKIAQ